MDEFDARNKHEESEEDGLRVTWQRVLAVRLFLYVEECVVCVSLCSKMESFLFFLFLYSKIKRFLLFYV